MKKSITALLILVMSITLLAGCGKNERQVFTTEQFINKMTDLGYDTHDETEDYSQDYMGEGVKKATLVYNSEDDMQLEFVEFEDVKSAQAAYDENVMMYEVIGDKSGKETKDEKQDYCQFVLATDEWHWEVARIKNTLLIFQNSVEKEESVQKFLEKIGYE